MGECISYDTDEVTEDSSCVGADSENLAIEADMADTPTWRTPAKAFKNGLSEYDYLNYLRYEHNDLSKITVPIGLSYDDYIPHLLRSFAYLPSIPVIDGLTENDYLNYLRYNYGDCVDTPSGLSYDEYMPHLIRNYNLITWPAYTTVAMAAYVPAVPAAETVAVSETVTSPPDESATSADCTAIDFDEYNLYAPDDYDRAAYNELLVAFDHIYVEGRDNT